ncbi:ABC transporter substrate-binding protein [Mycobacterium sp. 1245852.3]|uniref:ABC transporter substrate-binding protein n=1 Tax=Mycobacterium sp. 1245852.3 TaxID=1856860 RepID=UPI000AB9D2D3|nr:ABC transporter substrate-binding protein [Mycobacterium sp. 1245852.3]
MHTIDLAYVGRGIHEELIAHVADQEGYYRDEGVHVAIRDGVGWQAQRLRHVAVIGLGRALLSRLNDGIGWKALSVNTDRPLFWFLGNAEVKSMADLRGRRLAVHAADNPPGAFARIVLRKHSLDPDRDLHCLVRHPGDYQMDLRRLRDGSIDAAYVGSTLSPEQVAAEEGFHLLAWVGDHFQIPTVGVAVDPVHIPPDSPALGPSSGPISARCDCSPNTQAAQSNTSTGSSIGSRRKKRNDTTSATSGPTSPPDYRVDLRVAQQSIDAVARELGIAPVAAADFYRTG